MDKPQYKIYCDMDGVLADFMGTVMKRHYDDGDWDTVKKQYDINNKSFTDHFRQNVKGDPEFWGSITPLPDSKVLWNGIKKFNPLILSAYATWDEKNSKRGKRMWIAKHFRVPESRLIMVERENKPDYASPTSILIDDYPKNIGEWEAKGGIGIVHKSAEQTLRALEKLGVK